MEADIANYTAIRLGVKKNPKRFMEESGGQRDVDKKMAKKGWQCTNYGKHYCPEHAYKH